MEVTPVEAGESLISDSRSQMLATWATLVSTLSRSGAIGWLGRVLTVELTLFDLSLRCHS